MHEGDIGSQALTYMTRHSPLNRPSANTVTVRIIVSRNTNTIGVSLDQGRSYGSMFSFARQCVPANERRIDISDHQEPRSTYSKVTMSLFDCARRLNFSVGLTEKPDHLRSMQLF